MDGRGRRAWLARGAAAVALLMLLVSCGCQRGGEQNGDRGTQPTPSPSPTASPFTGEAGVRAGPVLAVKVDNVRPARPHTGVEDADLVYVERVESGLSRLVAVYSGRLPDRVGPVRSARESDLELLEQFGRPALGYSGVQSRLRPLLEGAPLYPVPPSAAPDAYTRGAGRPAPHNLYLRPSAVLAAAPQASTAADIGLVFDKRRPTGGEARERHTVRFPAASFGFEWSSGEGRWLVSFDGEPAVGTAGVRLSAATVVVQYVTVRGSDFRDRGGNVTPYTETVGTGDALVLRDGRAFEARWERPTASVGTRFSSPDGSPLPFAVGPVWFVLAEAGRD
nr:DUF3048 domain-containing protein [Streptomyces alkaliterrae]